MLRTLSFQISGFEVLVSRKPVKNFNLRYKTSVGKFVASVPLQATQAQIESFLSSNELWMRKTSEKVERLKLQKMRDWRETGLLSIWGKQLPVSVEEGPFLSCREPRLELAEGTVRLFLPLSLLRDNGRDLGSWSEEEALVLERLVEEFYRSLVRTEGETLISELSTEMRVTPGILVIKTMKSRWGSCKPSTGRICLNSELARYDPKYLRYVVVHELSHLCYANHGADFWAMVAHYEPRAKELRKELRQVSN